MFVGCNSVKLNSHWKDSPILVDGQTRDWDNAPRQTFEKPRISIAAINDDSTLYLMLHTNDDEFQQMLMRSGITLWFDSTARKKKEFGYSFRAAGMNMPDHDKRRPPNDGEEKWNDKAMMPGGMQPEGLYVLLGESRRSIPVIKEAPYAPTACLKSEGFGYTFELSVPLALCATEYEIGAAPGSIISVCIDLTSGRPKMKHQGNEGGPGGGGPGENPGMGSGPPGGGGRGGPGGGNGGGPGGREKGGKESDLPSEIWVWITLAEPVASME
jgi:hypothetical protein